MERRPQVLNKLWRREAVAVEPPPVSPGTAPESVWDEEQTRLSANFLECMEKHEYPNCHEFKILWEPKAAINRILADLFEPPTYKNEKLYHVGYISPPAEYWGTYDIDVPPVYLCSDGKLRLMTARTNPPGFLNPFELIDLPLDEEGQTIKPVIGYYEVRYEEEWIGPVAQYGSKHYRPKRQIDILTFHQLTLSERLDVYEPQDDDETQPVDHERNNS